MKKYLHVLHIIPGFGGGISSHVRNIIDGIDSDEVIIDVAGFTDYPSEFINEVEKKGGKTYVLRNVRMKNVWKCIREFHNILNTGKYDAVHMHLSGMQAFYFSVLSLLYGVKRRIVHAHISNEEGSSKTLLYKTRTSLNRILTKVCATDLASCSKLASEFRYGKKAVSDNRVMHIPNSIKVDEYFADSSESEIEKYKEQLEISGEQLVIGHVGFFGYQKNHPFMFKIAQELQKKRVDFVWLFIGTGYNYDEYVKLAYDMGLKDNVRFLGRRSDVCQLYRIMDVSVLASYFEGLPTVTIETQAAGTPTVISDTISDETDMGLNMIKRMSLEQKPDEWARVIIEMANLLVPGDEIRRKNIDERAFSTQKAAKLYTRFLKKEILHYNLGTIIEKL